MATNAEHPRLQLRPARVSVIAVAIVLVALGTGFLGGRLSVHESTPSTDFVAVPTLVGMTAQQAQRAVQEEGLQGSIYFRLDRNTAPNHVISQQPAAGSRLKAGALVQIVISAGPVRSGSK